MVMPRSRETGVGGHRPLGRSERAASVDGLQFFAVVLHGQVLHQPIGEEACLLPLADTLGPVLAGEGQQLGLMLPAPIACRFEFVIERVDPGD